MPEMAHGAMIRTSPASGVTPAASSQTTAAHTKKPAVTDEHPTIFLFMSAFPRQEDRIRIRGPPVPVNTDAKPTSDPTAANTAVSWNVGSTARRAGRASPRGEGECVFKKSARAIGETKKRARPRWAAGFVLILCRRRRDDLDVDRRCRAR